MKTNSITFYKTMKAVLLVFALIFSTNIYATSGKWGKKKEKEKKHNKHRDNNKKSDSVPLDGGLGILLLGAAAFGVKKLRENKNDKI